MRKFLLAIFGVADHHTVYLLSSGPLWRPLGIGAVLYALLLWRTPNENHHDVFAWMINTLVQAVVLWGIARSYLAHLHMVGPTFDNRANTLDEQYRELAGWRRHGFMHFARDTRRRLRELEKFRYHTEHLPFYRQLGEPHPSPPEKELEESDILDSGKKE